MKIRKKISLFLIINMLVLSMSTAFFVCPIKADVSTNLTNAINKANELRQNIADGIAPDSNGINQIIKTLLLPAGFICGSTNFTMNQLRDIYNSIIDQNDTDEQVLKKINDQLGNNITVNDNSLTYNDNSKNLLKLYANAVVNNSGFEYMYSIRLDDNLSNFSDGEYYNAVRRKLIDLNGYTTVVYNPYENMIRATNDDELSFVYYSDVPNLNYNSICTPYNNSSWDIFYLNDNTCDTFVYDSNEHEFVSGNSASWWNGVTLNRTKGDGYVAQGLNQNSVISITGYKVYKVYKTLQDLKNDSVGVSPYYINDSYNTNMNNSGNYTIDSSNSNNVTYGDVTNYVNNYYGTNNQYPNPQQIQIIIDNNNSGGGSGGGDNGGGSGGGSGGSGGSTEGIFDFLSKIGEVIGNLIANLGNVLAEILRGISELVSSVMETMPTFLTPLLHFVFGFLPPEIQAVIYLAIVGMLIVGLLNFLKK